MKQEDLERLSSARNCPNGDLSGSDLSGSYLKEANLLGANLKDADFSSCDMERPIWKVRISTEPILTH